MINILNKPLAIFCKSASISTTSAFSFCDCVRTCNNSLIDSMKPYYEKYYQIRETNQYGVIHSPMQ